jgi:hypothetical protein
MLPQTPISQAHCANAIVPFVPGSLARPGPQLSLGVRARNLWRSKGLLACAKKVTSKLLMRVGRLFQADIRADVEWRSNRLLEHLLDLRHEMDLLKSAREVPRDWFDEFREWKRAHPLSDKPLVSVCVPTYNRSALLTGRCLPSLVRQSYPHLQIIVVGDACTDNTAERVAALHDERIQFLNLPERGRYPEEPERRWRVAGSAPLNVALGLCAGELVTHLDDDDEYEPTRIEKLVAFVINDDLDLVWHPFYLETNVGEWQICPADSFRLGQVTNSSVLYRSLLARITCDPHAHLLDEPGDWNRFRKFKYLGVRKARFPEPLLRHYREQSQIRATAADMSPKGSSLPPRLCA